MNQEKILSIIINKINDYITKLMSIIISKNYNINNNKLTLNYVGAFNNNDIYNYLNNKLSGIIIKIENIYIRLNLLSAFKSKNTLKLEIEIEYLFNYIFYPNLISQDLISEILSNIDNKNDITNFCICINYDICNYDNLYIYLIYKNYNNIAKIIKTIEIIDNISYSKYYKDLYLTILDNKVFQNLINTSELGINSENQLIYRILFYINYQGVYEKINIFLDDFIFLEIMNMYTFQYLGNNNIYTEYAMTGNINIENCENKDNYMQLNDQKLNIELIAECIQITNLKLLKFQKSIIPWIGINDILTFFMIMDIKNENVYNREELEILKNILIIKYKGTKYLQTLLNIFENNN